MRKTPRRSSGFNLMEMMLIVSVVAVVAALGYPSIQNVLYRTQIRTVLRDYTNLVQQARLAAVRTGIQAVVEINGDDLDAFVDLNGAAAGTPPDGVLNPVALADPGTTDYLVGSFPLIRGLTFADPDGNTGTDSITGFVNPNLPDTIAVFQSDGSVLAAGAFRFADRRGNYFELRVAPAATGKVQLRKYDASLDANPDGEHWYAEGETSTGWAWN